MNQQETTPLTKYQKLVIFLLAITQFTVILDFMVISPLGDMLMKDLNLSTTRFGAAVSAYAFSAGVSGLLTAGFADKFDRKKLLLFFYTGFIGGTLFCGLAHTYFELITARIITGLFGGVIGSVGMAIITDLFTLQQRGRVMGFVQMGFGASQVLGVPIGLALANVWGWEATFLMVAGLAVCVAALIMLGMKPITAHLAFQREHSPLMHLWKTISNRHYRIGFSATALMSIGGFMMMPFGSAFAVNNLEVTYTQLPLLFMISGLSSLIIMPLVGKLSDKFDKMKLYAIASIWTMVMCVVYTNLSVIPFALVVVCNILLMMGVMSRMVPGIALVSAVPEMKDRGAFMSVNSSLQQIAGGIAAAAAGMIVTQKDKFSPLEHYNTVGYVVVVISMVTIFMIYRVDKLIKGRKKEKQGAPATEVLVTE
jgi:predicted MFS family arabinose efflux permease